MYNTTTIKINRRSLIRRWRVLEWQKMWNAASLRNATLRLCNTCYATPRKFVKKSQATLFLLWKMYIYINKEGTDIFHFLAYIISHLFSLFRTGWTTNLQHILRDPNENSKHIGPIFHYYSLFFRNHRHGINIILYYHYHWHVVCCVHSTCSSIFGT